MRYMFNEQFNEQVNEQVIETALVDAKIFQKEDLVRTEFVY